MTSPQGQDQVSASLLGCPFCGGPGSPDEYLRAGSDSRWHRIICEACAIVGPEVEGHSLSFHGATGKYESEAIAAWNRRTPPPAVSEVREAVADWEPVATWTEADGNVLLYAPPENLSDHPLQTFEVRFGRPRNFTWATLWMPLRRPGQAALAMADRIIPNSDGEEG